MIDLRQLISEANSTENFDQFAQIELKTAEETIAQYIKANPNFDQWQYTINQKQYSNYQFVKLFELLNELSKQNKTQLQFKLNWQKDHPSMHNLHYTPNCIICYIEK